MTSSIESADSANQTQPAALSLRRVFLDIGFTLLLIAAVVYGVLYRSPASPGAQHGPLDAILLVTLLPFAVLILLALIERLLPPAGPRKSFESWILHFQITLFHFFLAGFAGVLTVQASAALARYFGFELGLIDLRFTDGKGLLALLGAVWVAAVAGDFFFYWFHRALHKTPFLWAHHKMHHMDRELEAVTVYRQNWIEVFIAELLIFLPMAILIKVDTQDPWELGLMAGVLATVFKVLLGIGHMNVKLQVGKASVLYCSPQVHRIHHSCLPEHRDKNFAFILPLWDVLFGTYCAPKRDEFPPTGVEGETEIRSFWEAEIFTPREWWRMFRAWRKRT